MNNGARAMRTVALRAALGAALLACACGPGARTVAMQGLHGKTPRERSQAARELAKLGKPDDDELWVALERATRDPAAQVRVAAVESLAAAPKAETREVAERGALADDALSAALSDLDESVRIASARVLGDRCNERSIAYLHGALSRSGPAVREEVSAALVKCGVPLERQLARAEQVRRMRALEKLSATNSAWRTMAARELGLLGRDEDAAKITPLLDDPDGVVAAAAAEGLAYAKAASSIPALQRLAGDDVPVIASAAIHALATFGPEAVAGAQPQLLKQALSDGDAAQLAASALAQVAKPEFVCAAALQARDAGAAALLAHGCAAAPFGDALAKLDASVKNKKEPLEASLSSRAAVLVEALSASAAAAASPDEKSAPARPVISAAAEQALGDFALRGDLALAIRSAEVAQALHAVRAGPPLFAVARREKDALEAERSAHKAEADDHAAAARELADAAMRTPSADREKLAKLMAMVKARQDKSGAGARPDAAARLKQLLASGPHVISSHPLLAAALRASVALGVKGAAGLAASLRDDGDPGIASAARGEALPPAPGAAALAPDCFGEPMAAGAHADPAARVRAAKPGCLALLLDEKSAPKPAAPPEAVAASARASLWSDDGAERAAACAFLRRTHDAQSSALRASLAHDPERRVRDACAPPAEPR